MFVIQKFVATGDLRSYTCGTITLASQKDLSQSVMS